MTAAKHRPLDPRKAMPWVENVRGGGRYGVSSDHGKVQIATVSADGKQTNIFTYGALGPKISQDVADDLAVLYEMGMALYRDDAARFDTLLDRRLPKLRSHVHTRAIRLNTNLLAQDVDGCLRVAFFNIIQSRQTLSEAMKPAERSAYLWTALTSEALRIAKRDAVTPGQALSQEVEDSKPHALAAILQKEMRQQNDSRVETEREQKWLEAVRAQAPFSEARRVSGLSVSEERTLRAKLKRARDSR